MGLKRLMALTVLAAFMLLSLFSAMNSLASGAYELHIDIVGTGLANVTLISTALPGLNILRLPIEPAPETIEVLVNGIHVDYLYGNGTLVFVYQSNKTGRAIVSYIAEPESLDDGLYKLRVNYTGPIIIRVEPEVTLINIEPVSSVAGMAEEADGSLILRANAPLTISYSPLAVVAPTTTSITPRPTTTASPSPLPTGATSTSASITTTLSKTTQKTLATPSSATTKTPIPVSSITTSPSPRETPPATPSATVTTTSRPLYSPIPLITGIIVAVGAIAAILLLYRYRRGSNGWENPIITEELDDLDKAIIDKLREKGGSEYQYVLQRELGLPKTTMWRRIKRLEKLGIIRVEKRGKGNYIILVRDKKA
ncbi:MAG: winged helix-turn-helix transcriptional regulator [Pyrodictiaceae archaeon]